MTPLSGRVAGHVLRAVLAADLASGDVLCLRAQATDGALIDLDYGGTVRTVARIVVSFRGGANANGMDAIFSADEICACRVSELRDLVFSRRTTTTEQESA